MWLGVGLVCALVKLVFAFLQFVVFDLVTSLLCMCARAFCFPHLVTEDYIWKYTYAGTSFHEHTALRRSASGVMPEQSDGAAGMELR